MQKTKLTALTAGTGSALPGVSLPLLDAIYHCFVSSATAPVLVAMIGAVCCHACMLTLSSLHANLLMHACLVVEGHLERIGGRDVYGHTLTPLGTCLMRGRALAKLRFLLAGNGRFLRYGGCMHGGYFGAVANLVVMDIKVRLP